MQIQPSLGLQFFRKLSVGKSPIYDQQKTTEPQQLKTVAGVILDLQHHADLNCSSVCSVCSDQTNATTLLNMQPLEQ